MTLPQSTAEIWLSTPGLFGGDPVPAPARELKGWEDEAVEQLPARLVERGFEVLVERPTVKDFCRALGGIVGVIAEGNTVAPVSL